MHPTMENVKNSHSEFKAWLISLRRSLHEIPEPGFKEEKTSKFIQGVLKELGISFRANVAKTGIIAELGKGSPCVAIRADMDALKIEEKTGLPFKSRHPGFMHACGHDGHMAMALGACSLLKQMEDKIGGKVRFIFQPAEEGLGGAKYMIEEGALQDVSYIFGGHIDRHYRVGEVVVQDGLICAFSDSFKIDIFGKDGHAARPYEAIDSIVISAHLVTAIQSLVTRELNPTYPSVISIGKIRAGSAHNIIAGHATLYGTVRTTHPEIRKKVLKRFRALVEAFVGSLNAQVYLEFIDSYPPVINDKEATEIAKEAAKSTPGIKKVVSDMPPSLGGEDFSYYLEKVPGCFVRFGALIEGQENIPAHSAKFDFNEDVLEIGANFFKNVAITALNK